MNSGTIGDGVSNSVIKGMEEVLRLAAENYKNAALQYFSKKVTPNNFVQLQKLMGEKDPGNSGYISSSEFKRCLSGSMMKVTENEVEKLIDELDKDKTGQVNWQEFLKYSYLCEMYIYHLKLEYELGCLDQDNTGLVTVATLDTIL